MSLEKTQRDTCFMKTETGVGVANNGPTHIITGINRIAFKFVMRVREQIKPVVLSVKRLLRDSSQGHAVSWRQCSRFEAF